MIEELAARLDDKREELVALTRDLVRVPTVNPPGEAYGACAELIGKRLRRRGFAVEYVRAHGGALEIYGTVDEESGGFGGVTYLALAHQPDGFMANDDLVASAKVMALAAGELLDVTMGSFRR